jgi:hypothetical protein
MEFDRLEKRKELISEIMALFGWLKEIFSRRASPFYWINGIVEWG